MKNNKTLIIVIVSVLLILGTLGTLIATGILLPDLFDKNESVVDNNDKEEQNNDTTPTVLSLSSIKGQQLTVILPTELDNLPCSFDLQGEISGTWFFEGTFPIEIVDTNGVELANSFATAKEEWMTEEMVQFSAEITCESCIGKEAILILRKDNPSDQPEFDDSVEINVQFNEDCSIQPNPEPELMTVQVYFSNTINDPEMLECGKVYPTSRTIEATVAVGRAALNELLKGTTADEETLGFETMIPDGVMINRLVIENAVAEVDFNNALQEQVGGSCRVSAIRAQIEQTLKQFPTVDSVVISIEGESDLILQP